MTTPTEQLRTRRAEEATKIRHLAANMTEYGGKIVSALWSIAPAMAEAHSAHMTNNYGSIKRDTSAVINWANTPQHDAKVSHADIDRRLADAHHSLTLLQMCLHDASANLTRHTYAFVTALDSAMDKLAEEISK